MLGAEALYSCNDALLMKGSLRMKYPAWLLRSFNLYIQVHMWLTSDLLDPFMIHREAHNFTYEGIPCVVTNVPSLE